MKTYRENVTSNEMFTVNLFSYIRGRRLILEQLGVWNFSSGFLEFFGKFQILCCFSFELTLYFPWNQNNIWTFLEYGPFPRSFFTSCNRNSWDISFFRSFQYQFQPFPYTRTNKWQFHIPNRFNITTLQNILHPKLPNKIKKLFQDSLPSDSKNLL